ncbi:MAG: 30S ribosome-binding factor RbfA [Eubacteriales bacterium]|nr:30S ribosome-binding factor RbfA [Eubacteriales bacterium]
MSFQRIDRISEQAHRDIDTIVRDELNDPRISGTYSITRVEVTRDLSFAKVYVSVLEDDKRKGLLEALKHAAGFIRKELAKRMMIRYAPQLIFVEDKNIEYGIHISKVLQDVVTNETNTESLDD